MIKVALIGCGNIFEEHIAAYKKCEDVEVVALCDINEKRLKEKGEKHGVKKLYTDKNKMFEENKIDAVSICVPNYVHCECTLAALHAGCHVLCEKPMALNAAEAQLMEDEAKKAGKLLMIGFVRRHGNDCKILKEFINSGYFGDLYYAKATYLRRHGNPMGWFGEKAKSGGGPLIDLGVHVLDLVRYLFGNPKPVSVYGVTFQKLFNRPDIKGYDRYISASSTPDDVCDVEDLASVMVRFDNGCALSFEASFSLNIKEDTGTIELFGDKGGAKLSPELELFSEVNGYMCDTTLKTQTALSFDGLFYNEIRHFVDCVCGKCETIAPAHDGVEIMRILDAAYESAKTGHEVVLN